MPHRFFSGLDLGQASDFTALVVLEHAGPGDHPWLPEQEFHTRHLHRYPLGTAYDAIVADVAALHAGDPLAGRSALVLDRTGVGRPVWDLFARRRGGARLPIVGVTITAGEEVRRESPNLYWVPKRDLVAAAQVALQTKRLKIAPELEHAATLVEELQNYKYSLSAAGHLSYNAGGDALAWRERPHDDLVLSVALALWVAQNVRPNTVRSY